MKAQTDRLRHPGARVVHEVEQSPVATAGPGGGIGRLEDRPHLLARQKSEHRFLEPLHRDGQRLLDDGERGEIMVRGVLQERPQCRQPRVAATHRVFSIFLQIIEEVQNQLCVEVRHYDCRWYLADLHLHKTQQEPERIPIGSDGTRADGSMVCQVLDEKSLEQSGKGRCRDRVSHDCLAPRQPRSLRSGGPRPP